ncbi:DUF7935 family protein [Sphingobacterium wenxiniae]|nr:hypothetical protein [Sphingobacterium wenxiniae]
MMSKEFIDFFGQVLAITFGVIAGGLLLFRVLWPKIESYILKLNALNQNKLFTREMQQMRFAAYERLLLLTHRIEPQQLMLRNHQEGLPVTTFVNALVGEVQAEYQHNLAQQLYVSDVAWTYISDLKDNTIKLLQNGKKELSGNAGLDQYIAVVLNHIKSLDENPYHAVQVLLKKELNG